jgi:hypothetical protein
MIVVILAVKMADKYDFARILRIKVRVHRNKDNIGHKG